MTKALFFRLPRQCGSGMTECCTEICLSGNAPMCTNMVLHGDNIDLSIHSFFSFFTRSALFFSPSLSPLSLSRNKKDFLRHFEYKAEEDEQKSGTEDEFLTCRMDI